ncbi:hypothetical protein M9458_043139, partial [Cirrhinus mrigala]
GWYRLFINNVNAQIPDTCVSRIRCGTDFSLWIRGGHPTVQDGVVTRIACSDGNGYCCFYRSYPIKVKACPDNYYVYELVKPTQCNSAYCAGDYIHMSSFYTLMIFVSLFINHYSSKLSVARNINTSSTAVTPATISTGNVTHCVSIGLFSGLIYVQICTIEQMCEEMCLSSQVTLYTIEMQLRQ